MYFTKFLHWLHIIADIHNTRDVWTRDLDDLDHFLQLLRWARQWGDWGPRAENLRTQGPSLNYETPNSHGCKFAFRMHSTACWHRWGLE